MKNYTRKFCEVILDLNLWYTYSNRLKKAYEMLETKNYISIMNKKNKVGMESNDYMTTILMLRGMTIECLLKGMLVNQGDITCKDEELCIPKEFSSHNLISMVNAVDKITLSNRHKEILERLGYYIVAGRLPRKKINLGKFKGFWSDGDEDEYNKIIKEIEKVFVALLNVQQTK